MPTYEYVCTKCGSQFEKIQSMTASPLTSCPEDVCPRKPWGHGKVKKVISGGAGLIFKGSGFYITDYRSDKYKEAAKKEAGAASGETKATPPSGTASGTSAGGSADPKPAAKTEAKPAKPAKPTKATE